MTYEEAIAFLHQLPRFSPAAIVNNTAFYDLVAVRSLLKRLGDPQEGLRFIHIAGTNGKGSCAAFLESILREQGLRVGLYTSPFLERFNERIRVDGKDIADEAIGRLMGRIVKAYEDMVDHGERPPSEFEMVCALGFMYFKEKNCDVVVLETGLGGRLDATNVIPTPALCIITTISYDHTEILGETLCEIAAEKAGIIKKDGLVLLYPQQEDVERVFEEACKKVGSSLIKATMPQEVKSRSLEGLTFDLSVMKREWKDVEIGMAGVYQANNAALAAQAACLFWDRMSVQRGGRTVTEPFLEKTIRNGLKKARWPGRFEPLAKHPWVIIDGGHNAQGAKALSECLSAYFPGQKIYFVMGVLEDKSYEEMILNILPFAETFYCVSVDSPRALPAEKLAEVIRRLGASAEAFSSRRQAVEKAMEDAGKEGVVVVCGSLYLIGEVRGYFHS